MLKRDNKNSNRTKEGAWYLWNMDDLALLVAIGSADESHCRRVGFGKIEILLAVQIKGSIGG